MPIKEKKISFKTIVKRDGRQVDFAPEKIIAALSKALAATQEGDTATAVKLCPLVLEELSRLTTGPFPTVEEVQDAAERVLMQTGYLRTARAYITYRNQRTAYREGKHALLDTMQQIMKETHKENANVGNSPSAKGLQIFEAASAYLWERRGLPTHMATAHQQKDIHIHDFAWYGMTLTCVQTDLYRLLSQGFNPGHGYIRPPKRIGSAAALAAIILQGLQNDMHGGQSFPNFDKDIGPFAEQASDDDVYQAMESLIFNLNTLHSRAGAQVPFSSLNVGTGTSAGARKVTKQLLLAYKAGLGRGEHPIFPNIIFKVKEGINFRPGDPNYDLYLLALEVASVRLNPSFSFLDSPFNQNPDEVAYMGCRTRVVSNINGPAQTSGRGNLSFTSINLPRLAIRAEGNIDRFFALLDEMIELVIEQLLHRYRIQANLKAKDMPFLMGQHVYLDSDQLQSSDRIEPAIKHGTLSIGFIGLAEALMALCGQHHGQSKEAHALGYKIISHMRRRCDEATEAHKLNFTLLATPGEGLSGKMVIPDRERFGAIPGVTDRDFYTNSYHVPVYHSIGIAEKIKVEAPFHELCNAGHISYVELDAPPGPNWQATDAIVRAMAAAGFGYGAINFPVDECLACGYTGVFPAECPSCKSEAIRRIRRITGYLSTVDRFNPGKLAELKARVAHA
ncbi:MAG: anaerobic ribonucleoside-triphosphate reductase [Firmicutes bacterium]|nr:anaerobic ribonucleoside-triphosphate reductase [Bacillota bacterium]